MFQVLAFLLIFGVTIASPVRAESAPPDAPSQHGFLATWKLLAPQQRIDFMAGYLQGWHDASRVIDIAIDFVRDNPNQAVTSLERLRALYDLSNLKPDQMVREIDRFYNEPENRDATLSLAVSNARNQIK